MSSIKNFKGEVDDFGAVLGTTADQSNVKKKDEKVGSKLSYADIFIHENYLKTSGVLYYMDQE